MVSQGNIWYTVLSQLAVAAEDAQALGVGLFVISYIAESLNVPISWI